jgi:superfamily II DNA or RNA helicase
MSWLQIRDTDLGRALIETLRERPYLEIDEVAARLRRLGFDLDEDEVLDYFEDPDSPFFQEPARWFVDSDLVLEEDDLDAEDDDLQLDGEGVVQEDDDLFEGEADTPSRWIGPELRPWQEAAFASWREANEHGIVEAITGTGKTVVGAYAAADALDYGYKVAITVPTLDLMDQWIEQLESCIDEVVVGKMGDGFNDHIDDVDVLVATISSGSRKYMRSDSVQTLLIADEVHRMGSPSFSRALEDEMVSRLGLTATLERNNDTGVDDILLPYFGGIVHTYGYADALRDGVLAPFRLAFVGAEFTAAEKQEYSELGTEMARLKHQLQGAGLIRGDGPEVFVTIGALSRQDGLDFRAKRWAQKFMASLSRRRKLQASAENKIKAVETLSDTIALSERTLVFTETKEVSAQIAEILEADAIEAWPFDSDLARNERIELLSRFRDGEVQVLCAPRVLDEGIDVPQVDVGVIVSASQSRRQMIQRLGRIVRPNPSGEPSTLFLLYLKGTREDPSEGGHEGFLDEVVPHALEVRAFEASTSSDEIARWYSGG